MTEAIDAARAALRSDTLDERSRAAAMLDAGAMLIDLATVTGRDELSLEAAAILARGSAGLADEAIHIASEFQLAGYRHVVGALWPLEDATAAGVAERFYGHVTDGRSPADALHVVIRSMRDEQPLTPSRWAAYVHAGP